MKEMEMQDKLIIQAVNWAASASEEISKAGGSALCLLEQFSDKSIVMLVRNNLQLHYKKVD